MVVGRICRSYFESMSIENPILLLWLGITGVVVLFALLALPLEYFAERLRGGKKILLVSSEQSSPQVRHKVFAFPARWRGPVSGL